MIPGETSLYKDLRDLRLPSLGKDKEVGIEVRLTTQHAAIGLRANALTGFRLLFFRQCLPEHSN